MGNQQFAKEKDMPQKKQKSAWSCMNQENQLDQYEFNIGIHFKQPKGKITANSIAFLQLNEINFLKACGNRNVSAIRYYLQNGVSVNILDEERTSPLHVAVRKGSEQIIEELIIHGADVNITDLDGYYYYKQYLLPQGWTPLHVATNFSRHFVC